MVLFEVFGPDGRRRAFTEHAACIPDNKILRSMYAAGCRPVMDGKVYKTYLNKEDKSK